MHIGYVYTFKLSQSTLKIYYSQFILKTNKRKYIPNSNKRRGFGIKMKHFATRYELWVKINFNIFYISIFSFFYLFCFFSVIFGRLIEKFHFILVAGRLQKYPHLNFHHWNRFQDPKIYAFEQTYWNHTFFLDYPDLFLFNSIIFKLLELFQHSRTQFSS